jgi:hypothetical protein
VFVSAGRHFGLPPSPGEIHSITPGIDFPAESFFDVSLRIDLPGLGLSLHNDEPFRMVATIDAIPPYGATYASPPGQPPVLLFDPTGLPMGQIIEAVQTSHCQTDDECDDGDPCTSDSCDAAIGLCFHDPLPDSDGDGVCDVADNCPGSANPGGQAPLVFGQEIFAPTPLEFCWPDPADVIWVQGDLALVNAYAIDEMQVAPGAFCFAHPVVPDPEQGFYYLVKEDCPAGSWQNLLGVEPERDVILP